MTSSTCSPTRNSARIRRATIAADVNTSVLNEVTAIKTLVAGGAQTILVPNVPDIGLIPEITVLGAAAELAASNLAQAFNADLATTIAMAGLGSANVKILDTYSLIATAVADVTAGTPDPLAPGVTNVTGSVYTGGFTNDSPPPTVTGAAQNTYLFFDKLHPTEAGQMAVATLATQALGIACYVRGTHIAVPNGEVLVEDLAIGDLVQTASGAHRPVRWIGRRSYAGRFLAGNRAIQPVRFTAGSLGDGLPHRDLLVSPEHAMFLGGVLVPADCLINGTTIVQEHHLRAVEYVHVELGSHDVILAEGAASETFVDDASRAMFHNSAEFAQLYPGESQPAIYCAQRISDGDALEAIRQTLPAAKAVAAA